MCNQLWYSASICTVVNYYFKLLRCWTSLWLAASSWGDWKSGSRNTSLFEHPKAFFHLWVKLFSQWRNWQQSCREGLILEFNSWSYCICYVLAVPLILPWYIVLTDVYIRCTCLNLCSILFSAFLYYLLNFVSWCSNFWFSSFVFPIYGTLGFRGGSMG